MTNINSIIIYVKYLFSAQLEFNNTKITSFVLEEYRANKGHGADGYE